MAGYSYGGYYNYAPGFFSPAGAASETTASDECAARFRSYDPASGTFLGFDGRRHPCPLPSDACFLRPPARRAASLRHQLGGFTAAAKF